MMELPLTCNVDAACNLILKVFKMKLTTKVIGMTMSCRPLNVARISYMMFRKVVPGSAIGSPSALKSVLRQ